MARVGAVVGETAHRMFESERQQGPLVEAGRAGGVPQRALGAGEQCQVGEPDPARVEGGDTRREPLRRLPGGDRSRRRIPGHRALMPDPVDRRGRTLGRGFLGGGEGGRLAREADLEEVDPVAEPDQTLAELGRG